MKSKQKDIFWVLKRLLSRKDYLRSKTQEVFTSSSLRDYMYFREGISGSTVKCTCMHIKFDKLLRIARRYMLFSDVTLDRYYNIVKEHEWLSC